MATPTDKISRRSAIRAVGAAGFVGLAGCTGSNNSNSGGGSNNTNNSGGTTGDHASDKNANGVTITWWDQFHVQSNTSKQYVKQVKQMYEKKTGNTLNISYETNKSVSNGTWLSTMKQGKGPVLFDTALSRTGQFVDAGYVTPWSDFYDQFDSDIASGTKWAHDTIKSQFSGFDGNKMWEMPVGFVMQEPFVARADHFKKAGLDIESDFPPKNYKDLIRIAQKLQKDGPGDFGFQVHGSPGDVMDEISPTWAMEIGGKKGLYVNSDWSDTLLDSKAWKTALGRQVDLFRNKGLSAPNSGSTSDEDACQMLINGKASMSQVGMYNYGIFADRAPDMLKKGTLRYGQSWKGKSGYKGEFNTQVLALSTKPDKMDKAKWEKKKKAGIKFMEMMMSPKIQKKVFSKFGPLPLNKNVWKEIQGHNSKVVEAGIDIAKGSKYGWQAFPQMDDVQYNISGPIFQQAMNGSISAEEACNEAAKQIRNQVFR